MGIVGASSLLSGQVWDTSSHLLLVLRRKQQSAAVIAGSRPGSLQNIGIAYSSMCPEGPCHRPIPTAALDEHRLNASKPYSVVGQGGASAVDPTKMAVGMALIVLSQAVQAAQCTAEVRRGPSGPYPEACLEYFPSRCSP